MDQVTQIFQSHPYREGQLIAGRYRVLGFLGAGSMGWVLKVADEALSGEEVALKILYPHLSRDSTTVLRFRQEVVLARQLAHPSIIHLHDFETSAEGETFIALEYIDGTSLDRILKEQRGSGLPLEEALLILARVAEGLLYAHQQGVIHRDLKPANILVGKDGSIRISDFGLAKSFQQEFGLTRTGEALGTPLYMAPEQFRAEATDQRTDIYSFGVLAYELLYGKPPFEGDDFFALASQHISSPMRFDRNGANDVPAWLQELIESCCAKAPSGRPLTLAEVLPQLTQHFSGATQLNVALRHLKHNRRITRSTQIKLIALVSLVIGLLLGAVAWEQTNVKRFVCSNLLVAEYRLGINLAPLRMFLNIQGTLFDRQSAFTMLYDPRGLQLAYMVLADKKLRATGDQHIPLGNERDPAGYTLYQRAAQVNTNRAVEMLGLADADLNLLDPRGETVITASLKSKLTLSTNSLFSDPNLRIDGPNTEGDRPMHVAIKTRAYTAIDHFLSATPNSGAYLRTIRGDHVIHLAARLLDRTALSILQRHGIDMGARDQFGRTVLMEAVRARGPRHEAMELLTWLLAPTILPKSARVNALDNSGMTALMHAADSGNVDAAKTLIAVGADRNLRDINGLSAYDYAARRNAAELLPLLELNRSGAN